jgi:hypothetical protein
MGRNLGEEGTGIPFTSIFRDHVRGERDPYWRMVEYRKALEAKIHKESRHVTYPKRYLLDNLLRNLKFIKLDAERFPK